MLKPPVTHRLAQQTWTPRTWTPRRLNTRALSPSRGSTGRFSQRWQHSNSTTINGRSSAAIASAADGKTIGHPPGDACNGKGQATQASGMPSGRRALRNGLFYVLFGLAFSSAGAYASWHTLRSLGMGFYSDEESLKRSTPGEADAEARRIEETINNHPMVAELRRRPELTESRPHMKMPGQYRAHSLTGSALAGPGKVPVPAYAWVENGGKSLVSVMFVGQDLCGHPGLVHGGFLATMLDEGLARCCFGALPHNIGVTANLNINYRKPTPAGTYLVLRAETTKVDGRKAWVKGQIESLPGPGELPKVYAEATALFVSPKYAAVLPKIA